MSTSTPDLARPVDGGFHDAVEPGRRVLLPTGWRVARGAEGPNATLLLFRGTALGHEGGLLTLSLEMEGPEDIAFTRAWARVYGRPKLDVDPTAGWKPVPLWGRRLDVIGWSLSPAEATLVSAMFADIEAPNAPLVIETWLSLEGLRGAHAATARIDLAALAAHLAARVPGGVAERDDALREALNFVTAEHPGTPPILDFAEPARNTESRNAARLELAERILATAFEPIDGGAEGPGHARYRVLPVSAWTEWTASSPNASVVWLDLRERRPGRSVWTARWSLLDFWRDLTSEERMAVRIEAEPPAPLKPFPIHVTSTVPLDGDALMRVTVHVTRLGAQLHPKTDTISFTPDRHAATATIWGVQRLGGEPSYDFEARLTFGAPDGGAPPPPRTLKWEAQTQPHLSLSLQRFGCSHLQASATWLTWTAAKKVTVEVRAVSGDELGHITLTQEHSMRRLVLGVAPQMPVEARVLAVNEAGVERELRTWKLAADRSVHIGIADLQPPTETLELGWPSSGAENAREVVVDVVPAWESESRRVLLRPGDPPARLRLRRPSVFALPRVSLKARWLVHGADGWDFIDAQWVGTIGEEIVLLPPDV